MNHQLMILELTDMLLLQVILHGHVPPGMLARAPMAWFYPRFNKMFIEVLQKNADVITAAIFAHEHTDSFRIVYSKKGKIPFSCVASVYICAFLPFLVISNT